MRRSKMSSLSATTARLQMATGYQRQPKARLVAGYEASGLTGQSRRRWRNTRARRSTSWRPERRSRTYLGSYGRTWAAWCLSATSGYVTSGEQPGVAADDSGDRRPVEQEHYGPEKQISRVSRPSSGGFAFRHRSWTAQDNRLDRLEIVLHDTGDGMAQQAARPNVLGACMVFRPRRYPFLSGLVHMKTRWESCFPHIVNTTHNRMQ